jgi:hypothetical protein
MRRSFREVFLGRDEYIEVINAKSSLGVYKPSQKIIISIVLFVLLLVVLGILPWNVASKEFVLTCTLFSFFLFLLKTLMTGK